MKITLDISEEDIERITRSLDNQFATCGLGTVRIAVTSDSRNCFVAS
jgi:hypothetical protein